MIDGASSSCPLSAGDCGASCIAPSPDDSCENVFERSSLSRNSSIYAVKGHAALSSAGCEVDGAGMDDVDISCGPIGEASSSLECAAPASGV
jgi:hypothetical protein